MLPSKVGVLEIIRNHCTFHCSKDRIFPKETISDETERTNFFESLIYFCRLVRVSSCCNGVGGGGEYIVFSDMVEGGSLWQFYDKKGYFKLQSLVGICLHENVAMTSFCTCQQLGEQCNVIYLDYFSLLFAEFDSTDSQTYTFGSPVWWSSAKGYCECIGHLPIIDTEEKQRHLLDNVYDIFSVVHAPA